MYNYLFDCICMSHLSYLICQHNQSNTAVDVLQCILLNPAAHVPRHLASVRRVTDLSMVNFSPFRSPPKTSHWTHSKNETETIWDRNLTLINRCSGASKPPDSAQVQRWPKMTGTQAENLLFLGSMKITSANWNQNIFRWFKNSGLWGWLPSSEIETYERNWICANFCANESPESTALGSNSQLNRLLSPKRHHEDLVGFNQLWPHRFIEVNYCCLVPPTGPGWFLMA